MEFLPDGSPVPKRPTVKVVRPRIPAGGECGELVLLVEGRMGQRVKVFVGPSIDVLYVAVAHGEDVEVIDDEITGDPWSEWAEI